MIRSKVNVSLKPSKGACFARLKPGFLIMLTYPDFLIVNNSLK